MASMKAGRSRGVSALRTVGSFNVTVAMPSAMSTMTASFSVILASPNSGGSAVLAGEERAGAVDVDQGIDIEVRRYDVGPFVHVPMQPFRRVDIEEHDGAAADPSVDRSEAHTAG